jgi:hypothetical protein
MNFGDIPVRMEMDKVDLQKSKTYHVYPIAEIHLHSLSGFSCQCDPRIERYLNGAALVIHNDKSGALKKAN